MSEEQEGMLNQLPEDLLFNILQRLAPRCLANSRCVCKPWCTIIDTRCLLRSDLLPVSLAGIFINFHTLYFSEFFSRSSTIPTVSGYLPDIGSFSNHCNGLLLLENCDYVVNPATRQWVQLPPLPPPSLHFGSANVTFSQQGYLVFDPTLSPHYEVFLIPLAKSYMFALDGVLSAIEELEWPLPSCKLNVFSSRTKGWEERSFVREGEAAGTVADMRLDDSYFDRCHNAVYWRGVLYVHRQTNFVMRISLLDGKYQVINTPARIESAGYPRFYLGRSQKGVYCAFHKGGFGDYYVYMLVESCGKMDWVLKARISLRHSNGQTDIPTKPWTLQDVHHRSFGDNFGRNDEGIMEQKCECSFDSSSVAKIEEWDSDDDATTETKEWESDNYDLTDTENQGPSISFLGFHPYKEVVFLSEGYSRGLAYHLNSSKVHDLGNMLPTDYGGPYAYIEGSFPYTPWLGEFPEHVQESRLWKSSYLL